MLSLKQVSSKDVVFGVTDNVDHPVYVSLNGMSFQEGLVDHNIDTPLLLHIRETIDIVDPNVDKSRYNYVCTIYSDPQVDNLDTLNGEILFDNLNEQLRRFKKIHCTANGPMAKLLLSKIFLLKKIHTMKIKEQLTEDGALTYDEIKRFYTFNSKFKFETEVIEYFSDRDRNEQLREHCPAHPIPTLKYMSGCGPEHNMFTLTTQTRHQLFRLNDLIKLVNHVFSK